MKSLRMGSLRLAAIALFFVLTSLFAIPINPPPQPPTLCECQCPNGTVIILPAPNPISCLPECAAACGPSL